MAKFYEQRGRKGSGFPQGRKRSMKRRLGIGGCVLHARPTPTIVVNGKYRLMTTAGGGMTPALVDYLSWQAERR
jgi:hypothetical protein